MYATVAGGMDNSWSCSLDFIGTTGLIAHNTVHAVLDARWLHGIHVHQRVDCADQSQMRIHVFKLLS